MMDEAGRGCVMFGNVGLWRICGVGKCWVRLGEVCRSLGDVRRSCETFVEVEVR